MSLSNDCLMKTLGLSEAYEFLAVYPHSSASGHNLNCNVNSELEQGDAIYNASVMFKKFPFIASYPVPKYPPAKVTRPVLNGLDPCLALIKQKKAWEYYKDILLNSCDKSMVADFSSGDEFEEISQVNVHPNLAMLAAHMKKDPDRHFNASYNWYFSGSNIEIANVGEKKYLLRPNGSTGELLFSPLILHNNEWVPDTSECEELKFNLKSSDPACQVDVMNNIAVVRAKTRCAYLRVTESYDKVIVEHLFDINSTADNPFISVSVNRENINQFCTLSPNEEFTIWDVSRSSLRSKFNLNLKEPYSKDSWGYAYYIGPDTILYANRQAVHILDLRANNNAADCLKWPVNKLVDLCEEISCCASGNKNVNYIGTNHHLLSLDIRHGWTERWTHGITSAPSIIKILQRNCQDLVFVASQRSDNVVFIQNEFEDETSAISRIHPYSLPSLRESLHVARYNGLCLDHLLTSRFTMSLIGLCCFEDRNVNVIRCTSVGDIFWQKLEKSDDGQTYVSSNLSHDDIKMFEDFEFKCEEAYIRTDNKCPVTSVQNTENLIDYLYTSSCPDEEPETSSTLINQKLPHCNQLKTYCDFLAPVLLEAWDIDDMLDGSNESLHASQSDSGEVSSSDEECDIENAVSNWLATYSIELTTNNEYKIDDENFNTNVDDPNMNDLPTKVNSSLQERLIPTKQSNILTDPTQVTSTPQNNTEVATRKIPISSPIEKQEIIATDTNQGLTRRVTKQKPVPTSKKKYVSGF